VITRIYQKQQAFLAHTRFAPEGATTKLEIEKFFAGVIKSFFTSPY
jgi:hypothetical protein